MRPRQPDRSGFVTRAGVRVGWEVHGDQNSPSVLLLPTWSIADAGHWKFQVPVLARRYRVVVIEGRGNGRSDRPVAPDAYAISEYLADAVAVLDATGTSEAVLAGVSMGACRALALAAQEPGRVLGAVLIGPSVGSLADPPAAGGNDDERAAVAFTDDPGPAPSGWDLYNERVWRRDYHRFTEFFWGEVFTEPHSTKPVEDGIGWAHQIAPEVLIATELAPPWGDAADLRAAAAAARCPMLIIHGTDDEIAPARRGEDLAALLGADLMLINGGGHLPQLRDPIVVNRALAEFIDRVT